MTPALLGKKLGMTRVYNEAGAVVPCTVVLCEPNVITQVKTVETDQYNAVQLGYKEIKPKFSTFRSSDTPPRPAFLPDDILQRFD
jgi:large subunit ribosomal protein L3